MRGTRGRGTCPAPGGSRRRAHWQTHDAAPAAAWCCGVPVRVAISGSGNPGVTVAIPSCATVTFMIALTIFASVPGPKEPSESRFSPQPGGRSRPGSSSASRKPSYDFRVPADHPMAPETLSQRSVTR